MPRGINWYLKKELIVKTPFIGRLSSKYLEKARYNLVTMSLLFELDGNLEVRKLLNIPIDYETYEWVVVSGYYAMYMAALAALAKVNYRSKNHSATIVALDTFFVQKKLLEEKYLKMLENVKLGKEQLENLELARERREIAQYSVTKETTEELAHKTKAGAYDFVDRIEELIEGLEVRRFE
jgi:uncharacterized protein (UPF0332 family)